jgi:hypothetical protein
MVLVLVCICELDHSGGKENGRASMFAASIGLDLAALAATGGDDAVIAFLQRQPVPLEGFGKADAVRIWICGFGGRGHGFWFLVSGFWFLRGPEWPAHNAPPVSGARCGAVLSGVEAPHVLEKAGDS